MSFIVDAHYNFTESPLTTHNRWVSETLMYTPVGEIKTKNMGCKSNGK